MGNRITQATIVVSIALPTAIGTSPARADWFYDFDDGQLMPIIVNLDETPLGEASSTFVATAEGGTLTLQDSSPPRSGGATWTKSLDPEVLTDVRVTATLNPEGLTDKAYLGVVARSSTEPGDSYYAGLGTFTDGTNRATFVLGKAVGGETEIQLSSWFDSEDRRFVAPFTVPYVVELVVVDERDELDEEYADVSGRVLDALGETELIAFHFRDYGTDLPRLTSGLAGVQAGMDAFPSEKMNATFDDGAAITAAPTRLQAGDADQSLDFDQTDLVRVLQAAKHSTNEAATWGDGDWDGAPGGAPGNPPTGNGLFDQLDIIAALAPGHYLTGPYAAIQHSGSEKGGQTSIVYNAETGEVSVDPPAGTTLTSVNIDSVSGIFVNHGNAQNLHGSFDTHGDGNIFKATFGSSFGSLSFGNVAQAGLSAQFLLNDLTVVGSLEGGGDLGVVDLIYVPEPSAMLLLGMGLVGALVTPRRRRP